jgi:hypothetical protein
MRTMTMRERILAVLRDTGPDRVPFVNYEGLAAPSGEVWDLIGHENMGLLRWSAVHRAEHPGCRWESEETERDGRRGLRSLIHTPKGAIEEVRLYQRDLGVWAASEHFVKEPADYEVLLEWLRSTVVVDDTERFRRDDAELGDDGLPHVATDRTPFQQLWIQWVSIDRLCLHLVDCPDVVHACMEEMGRILREQFAIAARAGLPYICIGDNITAPIIGERYFRRYCVPYYQELAGMLGEDVPVFVHMDGDLKPLWRAIGESGVRGLDSMSPPPDNDTSVADAVREWPEMRIFVNFPSSVHVARPERIREVALQILQQGAHTGRLEIQVSENVPPGAWRTSYPAIVGAIREFTTG